MAKDEMSREMESLKEGLKDLAVEAHRENYERLFQKLDEGLSDIEALKSEFSGFVAEVRGNREAIEELGAEVARLKGRAAGMPLEEGSPSNAADLALLSRDIEALKTRVKWLESKATLPNMESLRARVEAIENQMSSLKFAVPTIIE